MSPLAATSHLQPNITLIIVASVLVAAGVYLLLERSLTRVLLGIVLMSNGVSALYLVIAGRARGAPLLGERPASEMTDPLPQAFVLTAIVISLATVAFVMAMAYRYWRLTGSDDVPDDLEDALVLRLAERDQPSELFDADVTTTTTAEEDPDEAEAREAEEQARASLSARRSEAAVDPVGEHEDVERSDAPAPVHTAMAEAVPAPEDATGPPRAEDGGRTAGDAASSDHDEADGSTDKGGRG